MRRTEAVADSLRRDTTREIDRGTKRVTRRRTTVAHTHTHTRARLTALFPGLPGWAGTRKVKPIWILLKQETASGSGISWAICKSAHRSRQITTPANAQFLQAGCLSCRPTNSVKALKSTYHETCKIRSIGRNYVAHALLRAGYRNHATKWKSIRLMPNSRRLTRPNCCYASGRTVWTGHNDATHPITMLRSRCPDVL